MNRIVVAKLPKTELGNDTNDNRADPDYLNKIEIQEPELRLDLGILPENIDTLEISTRPFIIDGRLLRGSVSCISGPPGVGKSAFEVATMVSVASGHSYLGEPIAYSGST